jgi:hypothetical protein
MSRRIEVSARERWPGCRVVKRRKPTQTGLDRFPHVGHEGTSLSYSYLGPSDNGTGEGGLKEVEVLVNGIALYGREAQLFYELVVEVLDVAFLRTDLQGLFAGCLETLLLPDHGHETDDIVALFN